MQPVSLDVLLSSVSGRDGLPDLSLNDQGVCQLRVDDRLTITLEAIPQEAGAHLYSVLIRTDDFGREALFETLLEAQLFGREIGDGMAFAYDRVTAEILLCRRLLAHEMSEDAFLSALTAFINWTDHWQMKLGDGRAEEPEGTAFDPLPPGHLIRA